MPNLSYGMNITKFAYKHYKHIIKPSNIDIRTQRKYLKDQISCHFLLKGENDSIDFIHVINNDSRNCIINR